MASSTQTPYLPRPRPTDDGGLHLLVTAADTRHAAASDPWSIPALVVAAHESEAAEQKRLRRLRRHIRRVRKLEILKARLRNKKEAAKQAKRIAKAKASAEKKRATRRAAAKAGYARKVRNAN